MSEADLEADVRRIADRWPSAIWEDMSEVRRAYKHLMKLFATDSIATLPVDDELDDEDKAVMLQEIEDAYRNLSAVLDTGDSL